MSDSTLSNWIMLRDLTLSEAKRQFAIQPSHIRQPASYGKLETLTEINNLDTMPGRLYFDGERFVLAYIHAPHISGEALLADPLLAGASAKMLASRAGKRSQQHVYAAQGVAVSVNLPEDKVDFVEIFQPVSLTEYEKQFYTDPGKFVK